MSNQKKRTHRRIREWVVSDVRKALADEAVLGTWAYPMSMPKRCSKETGLAVSTVKRFWNGAVRPNGILRTYDAIAAYGIKAFDTQYMHTQLWF